MASMNEHTSDSGAPVTAKDMPIEVRRLLKSYAFEDLHWADPEARHTIVVEILTRGDDAAEQWLWKQCSREEIRNLLRRFGGAGCDNEGRAILRRKLDLTEQEIPPRPFGFVPWRG